MHRTTTSIRTTLILRAALLSAVALGAATRARSATQNMPTTAPAVDAATADLVHKLADTDASARDVAQRQLLESHADGDTLMAALRAAQQDAARGTDLDLKLRLDTLLVQAQERADLGPTHISLNVHDMPLWDVLQEFNRQAHANFVDPTPAMGGPEQMPKVTLALDRVTFWAALKQLQTAAHVSIFPQGGDQGWQIMRSNTGAVGLSGDEQGAFLTQPTNATYNRNIQYQPNGGGSNENFYFQFSMYAEPKIHLDNGQGVLTLDRAVDSNGNDLMGAARTTQINVGGNGQNVISGNLQLAYPKINPGERFAELSGTIKIMMARRTQTLASDDLLAETAPLRIQTSEGVTLTIQPKQPAAPKPAAADGDDAPAPEANRPQVAAQPNEAGNDDGVTDPKGKTVAMTAIIDGGDPAAVDRVAQSLQTALRVMDADGGRMQMNNFGQTREAQGHVEIRLGFTRIERPRVGRNGAVRATDPDNDATPKRPKIKLQLDVPVSMRQIEVPFRMKDIKMP